MDLTQFKELGIAGITVAGMATNTHYKLIWQTLCNYGQIR